MIRYYSDLNRVCLNTTYMVWVLAFVRLHHAPEHPCHSCCNGAIVFRQCADYTWKIDLHWRTLGRVGGGSGLITVRGIIPPCSSVDCKGAMVHRFRGSQVRPDGTSSLLSLTRANSGYTAALAHLYLTRVLRFRGNAKMKILIPITLLLNT